jgi:hypothetical protein
MGGHHSIEEDHDESDHPDAAHPLNRKNGTRHAVEPLPKRRRGHTDGMCCILLVLHWLVLTWIGMSAMGVPWVSKHQIPGAEIDDGHPELLYRGVDHNG